MSYRMVKVTICDTCNMEIKGEDAEIECTRCLSHRHEDCARLCTEEECGPFAE